MVLLPRTTYHVTATQRRPHAALRDLFAWIMDYVLEAVSFHELLAQINLGHPQSVPNIALMVRRDSLT